MADAFADTTAEESGGMFKAAASSAKVLLLMVRGVVAESTSCFPAIAVVFAAMSSATIMYTPCRFSSGHLFFILLCEVGLCT